MKKQKLVTLLGFFAIAVALVIASCQDTAKKKSSIEPSVDKELTDYMHDMAGKQSGSMKIDLADEKQLEFVKARLAVANKTESNSPQLYRTLNKVQQQHTALKLQGRSITEMSLAAKALMSAQTSEEDTKIHSFFHGFKGADRVVITTNNNDSTANAAANRVTAQVDETSSNEYLLSQVEASKEEGAQYTYVDLVLFDENGQQVTQPGFKEVYAYTNATATTYRDYDTLMEEIGDVGSLTADSLVISTFDNGEEIFEFKKSEIALMEVEGLAENAATPYQTIAYSFEPSEDENHDDGIIKVCLNRDHGDCDYPMNQAGQGNDQLYIALPFKGHLELNGHKVNDIYLTSEAPKPNGNPIGTDGKTNIVIFAKDGTGKSLGGGATELGTQFFNHVSQKDASGDFVNITYNEAVGQTVVSWDIPQNEGIFENAALFDRFANVKWNIHLLMNVSKLRKVNGVYRPFRTVDIHYIISQKEIDPDPANIHDYAYPILKPLYFEYSCIAAGTQIRMADGSTKSVEDIQTGEIVKGNGMNLIVEDISTGIETIDMISIQGSSGQVLVLTQSHPVFTKNRGVVLAEDLMVADQIISENNITQIESIKKLSRVRFDGSVHNLKLASLDGYEVPSKTNAMFANGFLIGDLTMQSDMQLEDSEIAKTKTLERLAPEWVEDYLNSLK